MNYFDLLFNFINCEPKYTHFKFLNVVKFWIFENKK